MLDSDLDVWVYLDGFDCIFVAFCGCFFFKQKTAYEMRISDWSSDVCSSDLVVDGDAIMAVLALAMREAGELVDNTLVATVMSNLGLQIGRASCRERVCQYV